MSPTTDQARPGIALALSGGGFRATLFHCGTLWRLNELGYLPKLDRISSVSGGSITAGRLALRWASLNFQNDVAVNLVPEVIDPLRVFCTRSVDTPAIAKGALLPWKSISDVVQKQYEEHLLGTETLQAMPDRPRFIFNTTNMATGVSFRFSKPYAADYRIGMIEHPQFRVSLAVTASSAFPPILSPVIVKAPPESFRQTEGADLYRQVEYRERLVLTDGGAYDNLGLETTSRFQQVLVSDAGAPFGFVQKPKTNWLGQTRRVLDIAVNQSRALRKRWLIERYTRGERQGAYWGIMTEIEGYQLPDTLPVPAETTATLARIRTRLNPFSEAEQGSLINWGYAVCDAAMRRFVVPNAGLPLGWPYPEYRLDRPLAIDVQPEIADLADPPEVPSAATGSPSP
jgi:NTE family protein